MNLLCCLFQHERKCPWVVYYFVFIMTATTIMETCHSFDKSHFILKSNNNKNNKLSQSMFRYPRTKSFNNNNCNNNNWSLFLQQGNTNKMEIWLDGRQRKQNNNYDQNHGNNEKSTLQDNGKGEGGQEEDIGLITRQRSSSILPECFSKESSWNVQPDVILFDNNNYENNGDGYPNSILLSSSSSLSLWQQELLSSLYDNDIITDTKTPMYLVQEGNKLYSCKLQVQKQQETTQQDRLSSSSLIFTMTKDDSNVVGVVVSLDDPSKQEQAMAVLGSVKWVLVDIVDNNEKGESNNEDAMNQEEDYNDNNKTLPSSASSSSLSSSSSSSLTSTGREKEQDWQMIPAENLIAAAASTGTKIAFSVTKASNVGGLARALELGVNALCVGIMQGDASTVQNNNNNDMNELWKTVWEAQTERNNQFASSTSPSGEKLLTNKIVDITTPQIIIGSCWRRATKGGKSIIADRVCVDFVQNLLPEEGCWIGSSAKIMALVLSEAAASQYVPTRPFRVNAGPVHSYILMADNSTKYLSELQAADQVMVYNAASGQSRSVAVGRLKQEIRPCVLIELNSKNNILDHCQDDEEASLLNGQIFLQQAETVRLGNEGGKFLRVTDLEAQNDIAKGNTNTVLVKNPLLLRVMITGTHVGNVYTGKVDER